MKTLNVELRTSDFLLWTLTLDFGLWTLDFGFWILDFGFWILDFRDFRLSSDYYRPAFQQGLLGLQTKGHRPTAVVAVANGPSALTNGFGEGVHFVN
jgi:hypothetical protein